jgi:hypothetical protein
MEESDDEDTEASERKKVLTYAFKASFEIFPCKVRRHPRSHSHAVAPIDVFNTGLLTPQASQNIFDSDAATSLISPPPEDSARAGINRQSLCVPLPVFCSH